MVMVSITVVPFVIKTELQTGILRDVRREHAGTDPVMHYQTCLSNNAQEDELIELNAASDRESVEARKFLSLQCRVDSALCQPPDNIRLTARPVVCLAQIWVRYGQTPSFCRREITVYCQPRK